MACISSLLLLGELGPRGDAIGDFCVDLCAGDLLRGGLSSTREPSRSAPGPLLTGISSTGIGKLPIEPSPSFLLFSVVVFADFSAPLLTFLSFLTSPPDDVTALPDLLIEFTAEDDTFFFGLVVALIAAGEACGRDETLLLRVADPERKSAESCESYPERPSDLRPEVDPGDDAPQPALLAMLCAALASLAFWYAVGSNLPPTEEPNPGLIDRDLAVTGVVPRYAPLALPTVAFL